MSALPIKASTLVASPERIATPELARNHAHTSHSPVEPIRVLYNAMASCEAFTEAAEKSLVDGSVVALRLAFKHAEEAFEQAQQCTANLTTEELPSDVEQRMSDLGLRLDALWVRLVCVFR
jgi:hypothetical protein